MYNVAYYTLPETSGPFKSSVEHPCYSRIPNRRRLLNTTTAKIPTPQGVYIGEAAVTNDHSHCYVMAINTCSHEVDIEIPPQQLQPFVVDMSEDFFDSDSETPDEPPVVERIEHICERLHREHHDGQATEQIRRIVEKYHHLFLLKGDPPPRTCSKASYEYSR